MDSLERIAQAGLEMHTDEESGERYFVDALGRVYNYSEALDYADNVAFEEQRVRY